MKALTCFDLIPQALVDAGCAQETGLYWDIREGTHVSELIPQVLADAGWAQGAQVPKRGPFLFDDYGHWDISFCIGTFVKALMFLNSSCQFWL